MELTGRPDFKEFYQMVVDFVPEVLDEFFETATRDNIFIFDLVRKEDMTGVSGIGYVATGWVLPRTGRVILKWNTEHWSIAMYPSIKAVEEIHLHHGMTDIVYRES